MTNSFPRQLRSKRFSVRIGCEEHRGYATRRAAMREAESLAQSYPEHQVQVFDKQTGSVVYDTNKPTHEVRWLDKDSKHHVVEGSFHVVCALFDALRVSSHVVSVTQSRLQ